MDISLAKFFDLNSSQQISFLKNPEFNSLERNSKVSFLKEALQGDLSSKTTASVIKKLRELKFRDSYFYRRFLYHVDSSVANAARKAISETIEYQDSGVFRMTELIQKEKGDQRLTRLRNLLREKHDINAEMVLALLNLDDSRVREMLVRHIDESYDLDETRLMEAIRGAVWYVRAAIIQILSNRSSENLLDVIDYLMKDQNVEVKLKMIEALRRLERGRARPYLVRLKEDRLVWVSKAARRCMTELFPEEQREDEESSR